MDPSRFPELLGLSMGDFERLQHAGLTHLTARKAEPKKRIDYVVLQQTCRRMFAEGPYANQIDIARHPGVSRAW